MQPNRDARKPIGQLTLHDLDAFPVWEFAIDEEGVDGQAETWVRPVVANTVPKGLYSLSVACDFRTASGKCFGGFVDVTTARGVELGGAVMLVEGDRAFLPDVEYWDPSDDRKAVASALDLPEAEVFPLALTLRVSAAGHKGLRWVEYC